MCEHCLKRVKEWSGISGEVERMEPKVKDPSTVCGVIEASDCSGLL
jgi:hypothetical protein